MRSGYSFKQITRNLLMQKMLRRAVKLSKKSFLPFWWVSSLDVFMGLFLLEAWIDVWKKDL